MQVKDHNLKLINTRLPVIIFIIIAAIFISIIKFRFGDINYQNADATWHTLLTVTAYDETPIKDHLFLPIVTLGDAGDKWIPWGMTLPDHNGNYYYTSFSPAGYFAPWVFLKLTGLPVNEFGLYVFNTVLFCISASLLTYFIGLVYRDKKYCNTLCLIGGLIYISSPELLHGMGIVYWHQSLIQVTLILQIIVYYKIISGRASYINQGLFYFLVLINPYIEWTGYVANAGFALAEFIRYWKLNKRSGFIKAAAIGVLTILSFSLFFIHYILKLDAAAFLNVLEARFIARNVTASRRFTEFLGAYFYSFRYIWAAFIGFIAYSLIRNRKLPVKHWLLIFVMAFPLLENIIMKEHALSYSYDRMKAVFLVIFLICEAADDIFKSGCNKKIRTGMTLCVCLVCVLNINAYINTDFYIQEANYRTDNAIFADYINENYPEALYASNTYIRGYMNLLFERGIYENTTVDKIQNEALKRGKNQIVFIRQSDHIGGISKIGTILVYDMSSGSEKTYKVTDHKVVEITAE